MRCSSTATARWLVAAQGRPRRASSRIRSASSLASARVERAADPDAAPAFLEAARSLLRLGENVERGRALLDDVKCPVVVIHGRQDRFVPAAFAWAATEAHPDWMVRVLPGVGHVPQLEAPERWLKAVEDWFATLGG